MGNEQNDLPGSNFTAIKVMETKYEHLQNLVWVTIGLSGLNFIVLLVMIVQLSNEVFNK